MRIPVGEAISTCSPAMPEVSGDALAQALRSFRNFSLWGLTGATGLKYVRIAGSPDRRIAGSPDRRIAGSPDRRIAGSPDRRIAGSPDRRIAQPACARTAMSAAPCLGCRKGPPSPPEPSPCADADSAVRRPAPPSSVVVRSLPGILSAAVRPASPPSAAVLGSAPRRCGPDGVAGAFRACVRSILVSALSLRERGEKISSSREAARGGALARRRGGGSARAWLAVLGISLAPGVVAPTLAEAQTTLPTLTATHPHGGAIYEGDHNVPFTITGFNVQAAVGKAWRLRRSATSVADESDYGIHSLGWSSRTANKATVHLNFHNNSDTVNETLELEVYYLETQPDPDGNGPDKAPDPTEHPIGKFSVTITDGARPNVGVTITPNPFEILESDKDGEDLTIQLSGPPASGQTVSVSLNAPATDGNLVVTFGDKTSSTVKFSTSDWQTPKKVKVHVSNSDADTDDHRGRITVRVYNYWYLKVDHPDVPTRVIDTTVTPVFDPTSLTVTENGPAGSYDVKLDKDPGKTVSLGNENVPGLLVKAPGGSAFSRRISLNFTGGDAGNWNVAQTVEVRADADGDSVDRSVLFGHGADSQHLSNASTPKDVATADLAITLKDAGASLGFDPKAITVTEGGGAGTYKLRLGEDPVSAVDVTVNVPAAHQDAITVQAPGGTAGSSATVRFVGSGAATSQNPENWHTDQAITVAPLGDNDFDNEAVMLTHSSSDLTWAGGSDPTFTVNVRDKAGQVEIDQTSLTVYEGEASATYNVSLSEAPTTDVTVTITPKDIKKLSVSPGTLTFTPSDYATPKPVTVTAPRGGVTVRIEFVDITHAVSGYGSTISAPDVRVQLWNTDPGENLELRLTGTTFSAEEDNPGNVEVELHAPTKGSGYEGYLPPVYFRLCFTPGTATLKTSGVLGGGDIERPAGGNPDTNCIDHRLPRGSASKPSASGDFDVFTILADTRDERRETATVTLAADPDNALPASVSVSGTEASATFVIEDANATAITFSRTDSGPIQEGGAQKARFEFDISALNRRLFADEELRVPLDIGGTGITADDYEISLVTGGDPPVNAGVSLSTAAPYSAAEPALIIRGTGTTHLTARERTTAIFEVAALADGVGEGGMETMTVGYDTPYTNLDTSAPGIFENGGTKDETGSKNDIPVTIVESATVGIEAAGDVTEGANAVFNLTADPAPNTGETISVTYNLVQDGDFVAAGDVGDSKTVSIGDTGKASITVATVDDSTDENDGSLTATLVAGTGYAIASSPKDAATVNIADDEDTEVTLTATASVTEGEEATITATINGLAQSADVVIPVTASIDGENDTAEASDFDAPGSITIKAGEQAGTTPLVTHLDVDKDDDILTLALGDLPAGLVAGTPSSAAVTITDDGKGAEVTLQVSATKVTNGDPLTVTVAVDRAFGSNASIPLKAAGSGTNPAEADEWQAPASVELTAGAKTATATVKTIRDIDTADETFTVSFGSPLPANLTAGTPSSHEITIEDDGLGHQIDFSASPNPVNESEATTVTATANGVFDADVTVPVKLTDGTAEDGDYGALTGILINQGQTSGSASLTTVGDADTDDDTFTVALGTPLPSGVRTGGASATVVIKDTKAFEVVKPTLTVEIDVAEDDDGDRYVEEGDSVTVTAKLDRPHSADIVLPVDLTEGGAGASDYGALTSITIKKGQTTGTGVIKITDDDDEEGDEDFEVEVDANGSAFDSDESTYTFSVTILANDRPKPTVSIGTFLPSANEGGRTFDAVILASVDGIPVFDDLPVYADVTQEGRYVASGSIGRQSFAPGFVQIFLDDDAIDEPNGKLTITLVPHASYQIDPDESSVSVVVEDDDATAVSLAAPDGDISETGGSKRFTVTLNRALQQGEVMGLPLDFSIPVNATGTFGGLGADYTLTPPNPPPRGVTYADFNSTNHSTTPPTITFTGGAGASRTATFTLRAKHDILVEQPAIPAPRRPYEEFRVKLPDKVNASGLGGGYDAVTSRDRIRFRINDDDGNTATPRVVFSRSGVLTMEEGGSATFKAKLATNPGGAVTVAMSVTDGVKALVGGPTVDPTSLKFSATDWIQWKTVTVTAPADDDAKDEDLAYIEYKVTGYGSVTQPLDTQIRVLDKGAGLTLSPASTLRFSVNQTGTYTVKLKTKPTADVTVTPVSSNEQVATVSGDLTFTASNWNTAQTVTVTGKGAGSAEIKHTLDSSDDDYDQDMAIAPVDLTVQRSGTTTVNLSADKTSVEEGGSVTVTAELSQRLEADFDLTLRYQDNNRGGFTAETSDYAKVNAIKIAKGTLSGSAAINIANEAAGSEVHEGDETFQVYVFRSFNPRVDPGTTRSVDITITDESDQPVLELVPPATPDGAESDQNKNRVFKVTKTGATELDASVTIATANGTAEAPGDYTAIPAAQQTLKFAPGDSEKSVTVTFKDDSDDELREDFSVAISSPTGAKLGTVTKSTIAITDDDPTNVQLEVSKLAIAENGGTRDITVTLGRALESGEKLPVTLTFVGAAGFGTDYTLKGPDINPAGVAFTNLASTDRTANPPTVTFTGGDGASSTATLTLTASDDNTDEGDSETVTVSLGALDASSGTGLDGGAKADATKSSQTFEITDDDTPGGITLTVDVDTGTDGAQAKVSEVAKPPSVQVTATIDGGITFPAAKTVTVSVGGGASTAKSGTDYTAVADFDITIPANTNSATDSFTLTPVNDGAKESDETILVTGAVPSESTLTVKPATITLIDFSVIPEVSVSAGGGVTEGNDASFALASSEAIPIDLTVSVGLTQAGSFVAAKTLTDTTKVTIPANATSAKLSIATLGDAIDEIDGSVTVTVNAAGNGAYTIASKAGSAAVAVTDDDATSVALTASATSLTEGDTATKASLGLQLGRDIAAGETVEVPLAITTSTGVPIAETNAADRDYILTATATGGGVSLTGADTATPKIRFTGAAGQVQSARLDFTATARDDDDEDNEALKVTLGNLGAGDLATNVSGGVAALTDNDPNTEDNSVEITIVDDEASKARISISVGRTTPEGGSMGVAVSADPRPTEDITVHLKVIEADGSNYLSDSHEEAQSFLLKKGIRDFRHSVYIPDNDDDEADGALTVTLVPDDAYRVATADPIAVTIRDNDATPLSFGRVCAVRCNPIGENGGTAEFRVRLDRALDRANSTVTVPINVSGASVGTQYTLAVKGGQTGVSLVTTNPYSAQNPALRFGGAGASEAFFTLTAVDNSDTTRRTVTLAPGTPTWQNVSGGVSLSAGSSVDVVIANDDGTPVVRVEAFAPETTESYFYDGIDRRTKPVKTRSTRPEMWIFADPVPQSDLSVSVTVTEEGDVLNNPRSGNHTLTIRANQAGPTAQELDIDNDQVDEPTGMVKLQVNSGQGYTVSPTMSSATMRVIDNDGGPTVSIAAASAKVTEGDNIEINLTRGTEGTERLFHSETFNNGRSDVRLRITQRGNFVADENLKEQIVVFNKDETTKTHVVPIVNDSMGEKDGTVTVELLPSARRNGLFQYAVDYAPGNRAVIAVADDDGGGPGVLIYNIDGDLNERKLDKSGSYQVELATDPGQTATLTVNVPAAHRDSVTVQAPGGAAGASATLTFTPGQGGTWDTPQTVTLTPLVDDDGDIDSFSITNSIAGYTGVTSAPDVPVTVNDLGYSVERSRASLEVAEPAGQETYGLHLLSAPKVNVVITPASSDTELATVSGPLTFTPTDWRQPKLVTVSGLKVGTLNVTHSITTTDAGYGALTGNHPVAVTVIADNRRTVNLAATPNPATEGAEVTLTATIDQAVHPARDVVIPLTYSDGTAGAADYGGAASLTIASGKVTGTATVAIADDTAHETPDETFIVAFGVLPRELLPGGTTSVEVAIDDAADVPRKVDLSVASSTVREGGEPSTVDGATTYTNTGFELTATLDAALTAPVRAVTIPLSYTFGTAAAEDITQIANVTIPSGETNATVTIEVVNDSEFEATNETFSIGLGALPDGVVAGTAGSVALEIDDANDKPRAVSLSVASATVEEASIVGGVQLTATLDQTLAAPERAVTVPLTYTPGTAEAEDFTEVESVTIPAGETSAKVTIPVVDDTEHETPDETFTIGLGALPDDLTAGAKTEVEISISDASDAPRTVSFGNAVDRPESRANASVVLTLSRTLSKDVTIPLIVTLGSAEADDFNLAGTVTIKANDLTGSASLQIVDNDIYEGPETFTVTMGELPLDASELTKGEPDSQVNTILDQEDAPSFKFASSSNFVTVSEGAPELALVRTGKVAESSFLGYRITAVPGRDGAATPGKDFRAVDHANRQETAPLAEIPADDTTPAFPVPVIDDAEDEWEREWLQLSLLPARHKGVSGRFSTSPWIRIVDDDPTPVTLAPSGDLSIDEDDEGGSTASLTVSFARALRRNNDPLNRPAHLETATIPLVLSSSTGAALPGSANPDFSVAVTGNGVTASGLNSATPTITFTGNRAKPPGDVREATITLTAIGRDDGDYQDEIVEIVFGDLASASNTLEGGVSASDDGDPNTTDNMVSIGIVDDEEGPDGFTLSVDTDSVAENAQAAAAIEVTATAQDNGVFPSDQEITITVGGGKDDTAVSGTDYAMVPSFKISVSAGDSSASASFSLSPTNDALDEADETLSVTGVAGQLTIVPATVTIIDDDPEPTVSVADASAVSEGDDPSATVDMRFTVSLSAASGKTVTVPYALGGTATAGDDYAAPDPLSVAIAPGTTSADIVVPVKGDAIDELTEAIEVTFGAPTNAEVGSGQGDGAASGDITDDDETSVTLSATGAAIAEAGGTKTITVALGRALAGSETLSVPLTFGGTADFASDYTLSEPETTPTGVTYSNLASDDLEDDPPTVAFSAGVGASSSATLTLTATADTNDEDATESVSIGLGTLAAANLDGGAGGSGKANFDITDDDDAPVIAIDAPRVDEGASGAGARLRFTVTLDAASGREVTVAYAEVPGGTATQGADYTALAGGTLTFDAGETSKHIDIAVTGDDIDEDDETVKVRLSSPSNATLFGGKATLDATGTITDDDAAPTVSVANASAVTEGNDPKTTADMSFAVSLSAASSRTVTVPYTLGGTADEGDDYTAPDPTSLTISAGSTSANIVVPVKGDELVEANETITVALGAPTNATVSTAEGAGTATGTITDDEATPTATLILTPASIAESGATNASTVTASLSGASDQAVTLTVAAAAVSPAKAGDFALSGTTLTVAAGAKASTGTVTVTAVDDKIDGPNKTVTVSATASGGRGVANPASAALTITDDDDAPTGIALAVDPTSVAEDAGVTAIEVTASTTGGTAYNDAKTLAITVGSGTGSATPGDDYTAAGFSMTLPAGQASVSRSFNLTPVDDRVDEDSETIEVAGTTTGASLSPATVTLTDNDTRGVTVTGGPLAVLEADNSATSGTREDQATYTVALTSQPTDDVTVNIGVPEGAPFTVSPTSLTFTASGNGIWSAARKVTVAAVDDDIDNSGDARSASITHTVDAGNSDYGDVTASAVRVTVNDDDAAPTGITLTTDTASIAEDAAAKTVKVTATVNGDTTYPTDTTVRVTVGDKDDSAASGDDYAAVAAFDIKIEAGKMSGEETFNLDPTDDALDEVEESISVEGASGALAITGTSIKLTDDDVPELSIAAGSAVDEGTAASFTVNASPAPAEDLTVNVDVDATASFVAGSATGKQSVSLLKGSLSQTYNVATQSDTTDEADGQVDVTLESGDDYAVHASKNAASVPVNDDDATTVTLARAGRGGIAEDGGTEDITITLGRELVAGESVTVPLAITGVTASTHYTIGLRNGGGTGVTIDTGNPNNAGNPAVTLSGAGAQVATLTLTAVDTNDTDRRTVSIAFGTSNRAPSHSGLSGGIRTAGSASVPIDDDDALVTVADAQAAEGSAVVFTFSLPENAPSGGVTVGYSTSNGRGESGDAAYQIATGDDYTAAVQNAALTIAAGARTGTISIDTRPDTTYEGDHHFTLTLDSTSFFNIDASANSATGTITDAQDTPSFEFSSTASTVAESVGTLTLTVERTGTTLVPATVTYETTDDTAAGGSDFTAISATDLVFAAGDASKTVTVTITDDSNDELTEAFSVDLVAKAHARLGTDTSHDVTITDNDATSVTLAATGAAIAEGDGAKTITVTLGRALTGNETLSVPLTFAGDATFGADYTLAGPQTLPTGVTISNLASTDLAKNPPTITFTGITGAASSVALTLTASDDDADEGAAESVTLGIGTLAPANLDGGASKSGTPSFNITDDDDAPTGISLSVSPSSISENAGATTVTVTANVTGGSAYADKTTVTVSIGAAADSAADGIDYTSVDDFDIDIAAGAMQGTKTFALTPTNDALDEPAETIRVSGAAADLTVTSATITLNDDDVPELSVSGGDVTEGADASFTIAASPAPHADLTVNYGIRETGGFVAAGDTGTGKSVTLKAGSASVDVDIDTTGDAVDEPSGSVTLTLAGGTGYALSSSAAAASIAIQDDDATVVTLAAGADASITEQDPADTGTVLITLSRDLATGEIADIPLSLTSTTGTVIAESDTSLRDFTFTASGTGVTLTGALTATPRVRITGGNATEQTATLAFAATTRDDGDQTNDRVRVTFGSLTSPGLATVLDGGIEANTGVVNRASIDIIDYRTPALVLSQSSMTLIEGNADSRYTVQLSSDPRGTVTVRLASSDSDKVSVTPATLSFTSSGATRWNAPRTVMLHAELDADTSNESETISHAVNAPEASPYRDLAAVSLPVTVTDSGARVRSSKSSFEVRANGGKDFFHFFLASTPAADVKAKVDNDHPNLVKITPSEQTFDASTWQLREYLRFEIEGLNRPMDGQAITVRMLTESTDPAYNGKSYPLSITILEDQRPKVTLSATPEPVAEGANLTVTAEIDSAQTSAVTVPLTFTNDTTTNDDYTAVSSITIPANDTEGTATVAIADDNAYEGSETFEVAIGSLDDAYQKGEGVAVTIDDEDDAPSFSFALASSTVDEDAGTHSISVTKTGTAMVPVSLAWATADGTAAAASDYTEVTEGSLEFAAADASQTIEVTITDDDGDELAENFHVDITAGSGAQLGSTTRHTVTVTDDDPTTVALSAPAGAISEAGGAKVLTVSLGRALETGEFIGVPLNVGGKAVLGADYALTAPNPAPAGVRYANLASTDPASPPNITFSGGTGASISATLTLTATADAIDEGDNERVRIRLGTLTTTGLDGGAAPSDDGDDQTADNEVDFRITDDDAAPVIAIDAPRVEEGASGADATLTFTVRLDAASGREVTVAYAEIAGGTATQGTDYTALTGGTLTFKAGETEKDIAVTVTGDDIDEDNETVKVRLSSPSNATLFGGTADEGDDYTAPNPTSVTISAGSSSANIVVPVKGDALDEANETVTVTLDAPTNATVSTAEGAGTATGTITDDEATPTATLILTPASIAESGASNASTVTASLSGASDQAVTLAVAAAAVSPAKSGDFALSGTTLTVAAGARSSTGTVTVTAVDDKIDGPNKTVTVSATASGGRGVANPASAALTITDDDDAPTGIALSASPSSVGEGAGETEIEVTATVTGGTAFDAAKTVRVTSATRMTAPGPAPTTSPSPPSTSRSRRAPRAPPGSSISPPLTTPSRRAARPSPSRGSPARSRPRPRPSP